MVDIGYKSEAYFWKMSNIVLSKIKELRQKQEVVETKMHNEYLSSQPLAAKKLFIDYEYKE